MKIIEVIILGIVQGIGEFLPISSSAHLIIFRDLFGISGGLSNQSALAFDVALHLGTLLAIIIFFFHDFLAIIIEGFAKGLKTVNGRLMWYLVLATIPAALFGFLFENEIESLIRGNYWLIAASLAGMGIIIYLVDHYFEATKELTKLTLLDSLLIGLAQIFALIPGFSRSGTTIATGRARQLTREDAAKFSFYLSAPIVLGAVLVTLLKKTTMGIIATNLSIFIVGILVAFISGLLCIKFLLQYLRNHDFKIFMWYRLLLALIVVMAIMM